MVGWRERIENLLNGGENGIDVNPRALNGNDNPVLGAGENFIGKVGGSSDKISPIITVDSAAYAAGDCVGGKLTLTGAMRVSGGTGILQNITVIDASNIKPALEIILFNSNPSAATLTDNAAIVFSTDVSKIITRISVATADYTTVGNVAIADVRNIGEIVKASGSADLFAALVATGAPDFVTTTDLQVKFGFMRD